MGLLNFILKLFRIKPGFNGTPEMFLAMVMELQSRNNKEFVVHEVLQWGEVMQKMMKVDLSPYTSFTDLMQNGVPDYTMVEKVRGKFDEINQRIDLKKAIYGENVDLGDDDVMTSNEESAVFARTFVKDMSQYVDFPDEEKIKLDKL
jgi:L-rhamnose mutarotase